MEDERQESRETTGTQLPPSSGKRALIQKLLVAGVAVLVALTLLIVYFTVVKPKPHTGGKTGITLQIEYADRTYEYSGLASDGAYVVDLLKEYDADLELGLTVEDGAWGAYIVALKGKKVDGTTEYYTYTVNGNYAEFGISSQPLETGAVYTFTCSTGIYNEAGEWTGDRKVGGVKQPLSVQARSALVMGICGGVVLAAAAVYVVGTTLEGKKRRHESDEQSAASDR